MRRLAASLAVIFALLVPARAEEALVAVATNFLKPAQALEAAFEEATPHRITLASGSTGALAAQILNGAPYHAFLAADAERPARLEAAGLSQRRFPYALGRLVLWSANPQMVDADGAATLKAGRFRRLAMANPALAPYGNAAAETLAALGLDDLLEPRIVLGQNVGQAGALVATGNAELGFVAAPDAAGSGSTWLVPEELHEPIRQEAVLLARAPDSGAAGAFLDFLRGKEARNLIAAHGYDLPK